MVAEARPSLLQLETHADVPKTRPHCPIAKESESFFTVFFLRALTPPPKALGWERAPPKKTVCVRRRKRKVVYGIWLQKRRAGVYSGKPCPAIYHLPPLHHNASLRFDSLDFFQHFVAARKAPRPCPSSHLLELGLLLAHETKNSKSRNAHKPGASGPRRPQTLAAISVTFWPTLDGCLRKKLPGKWAPALGLLQACQPGCPVLIGPFHHFPSTYASPFRPILCAS